jgi:hypothetical protein
LLLQINYNDFVMKERNKTLGNLLLRTKTPFNIRLANYLELSIRFDCRQGGQLQSK